MISPEQQLEHDENCDNGHLADCEALEQCYDLMDLWSRKTCKGCCPHGEEPQGMQALQDAQPTWKDLNV